MARPVDAVRGFVAAHGLAGPGLAAVSGGADSVALLHALRDAGLGPLTVGHFDHQLRGEASASDARFVEALAARLGLPFRLGTADVAAEVEAIDGNLEAVARQFRYDWLAATAVEVGAAWIATGHTADDQAETVLHRIVRGTGIDGLRGIAASRPATPSSPVRLVRPLLTATRADVLADLAERDQSFVEDETNADPRFTRARIRREVLPLLRTFNPEVVGVLGRLAGLADGWAEALTIEADKLLRRIERPRAGPLVILDVSSFAPTGSEVVHSHLLRETFRLLWRREGWSARRMTAGHWKQLAAIALGDPPAADFPDGVTARRVGAVVQLVRRP